MRDGVELLADHHYPRGAGKVSTLLVRSCYGKAGLIGFLNGLLYAERGFQVLIQNCRGTFGSGGHLNPFHQEQEDGLATIEWLKKQEWFSGELATVGASYHAPRRVLVHDDRPRRGTGAEGHVGPGYSVRIPQSDLCWGIIRNPRPAVLGLWNKKAREDPPRYDGRNDDG